MPNQKAGWRFDNSYARLAESFYARMSPVPVRSPELVVFNGELAAALGLQAGSLAGREGAAVFSGNSIPEGAEPIAQAYAGHQFGHFTMLGDGRAILLGEHLTPAGERLDIQLKGSGPTPFSRRGDGRAALGPMLREYIISEAMHGLGVPSTRSLAVAATGETVFREKPLPGAVLTRVARSHIRVGTFEYAAALEQPGCVRALADYTLRRHFPDLALGPEPYLALLRAVMERQASLIAKWMHIGFVPGVMNTDNMALSGETIDYGPCAFMDHYSPATLFSSIDRNGRYAYGNQPRIAEWNLACFAETLLPLLHSEREEAVAIAKETIGAFSPTFQRHWLAGMRAKLGLLTEEAGDIALIEELLQWMERNQADYTNTFRALSSERPPEELSFREPAFIGWRSRWEARQPSLPLMRSHNPAVIPRNHRVEEALEAAVERSDYSVMERLLAALKAPYEDSALFERYRAPPPASDHAYQTFCGT
jgi:uncharacterized protein YdiU (UPF0061 family)